MMDIDNLRNLMGRVTPGSRNIDAKAWRDLRDMSTDLAAEVLRLTAERDAIVAANQALVTENARRVKREEDARGVVRALLKRDEINTCQHENTHRGGFLWEICEDCGGKWADDMGGKPTWKDPAEWIAARAFLERDA